MSEPINLSPDEVLNLISAYREGTDASADAIVTLAKWDMSQRARIEALEEVAQRIVDRKPPLFAGLFDKIEVHYDKDAEVFVGKSSSGILSQGEDEVEAVVSTLDAVNLHLKYELTRLQRQDEVLTERCDEVIRLEDELATARRERDEWKQITANRDAAIVADRGKWSQAMTERDEARAELSDLRARLETSEKALVVAGAYVHTENHDCDCAYLDSDDPRPCDCGLSNARAQVDAAIAAKGDGK